jgi:poly(3-hydroxybutyrate) depolymerase
VSRSRLGVLLRRVPIRAAASVVAVLALVAPAIGRAAPPAARFADWPCPGCAVEAPARGEKLPLLVVLHGDGADVAALVAAWRPHAAARGYVLFAPRCPKAEGCRDSWWKWGGDPAWLLRQIDAVAARFKVDPGRVFAAGWSGGATYLGMNVQRFAARLAGLAWIGGGHPPTESRECAARKPPLYVLIGERDTMRQYAEPGRDFVRGCGHEVNWDLRRGKGHQDALKLVGKADGRTVLEWLEAHAPKP